MVNLSFEADMQELTDRLCNHIININKEHKESILIGFVDSRGNLYPITLDTKVLSKVVEFIFMPIIKKFCKEKQYTLEEPKYQNHYPDLTFIDNFTGKKYAVDIKTTYRITEKKFSYKGNTYLLRSKKSSFEVLNSAGEVVLRENVLSIFNITRYEEDDFYRSAYAVYDKLINENKVNGMTLGAYTGYFRDRNSNKNISYPYSEYSGHYVIGMIYSREELENVDIRDIRDYEAVESPIYDITMFFIEKYKIATKSSGSGNTKNIGSVRTERELINGLGEFQTVEEFDNFWLNYK